MSKTWFKINVYVLAWMMTIKQLPLDPGKSSEKSQTSRKSQEYPCQSSSFSLIIINSIPGVAFLYLTPILHTSMKQIPTIENRVLTCRFLKDHKLKCKGLIKIAFYTKSLQRKLFKHWKLHKQATNQMLAKKPCKKSTSWKLKHGFSYRQQLKNWSQ